jgi:hypothetical protein
LPPSHSFLHITPLDSDVHGAGHRELTASPYRAGVPQVIFPQWFEPYNFARLVESTGIGDWDCPETSPEWTVECLANALLTVTTGDSALDMRRTAKELEETVRSPGSPFAAREIAKLAAAGGANWCSRNDYVGELSHSRRLHGPPTHITALLYCGIWSHLMHQSAFVIMQRTRKRCICRLGAPDCATASLAIEPAS